MLPDTLLGHYRILSPLGKGGMGEVYAAEDTRLHRTVALKILPLAMGADPDRRKRFEREAQAVAALNHPNIVTIYSVEEASGVLFLTMEAVEGRTLKEMIPEGGMPLDVLLRVGMAVADAMAAAHQRGITHRDLKPANVMVTPDGRVKVLDFGLAKLREAEREADGEQPTVLREENLTGEGRIIGTVAYMSPEQAEGRPVDQRSDIFSLGVMLHEMAAGDRPFKGDTDISVISSIIKDTPGSITDRKPDLPAGLARVVRRCLAKDPARRYQTATDVRNDLEEVKQDLDSGVITTTSARPAPARQRVPVKWIAIGAIVLLAIVAAGLFAWMATGGGTVSKPAAVFAADRFTRLTQSGSAFMAALSAEGRYVVHVKLENGLPGLWVRQTATTSDVRVVPPANVRYDGVAFSPDGNYVYYVTYPPSRGVASLYRIHETPDPAKVMEFEEIAGTFGYSLGIGALPVRRFSMGRRGEGSGRRQRTIELPAGELNISSRHYQQLTDNIAGKPEERILSYLMLRSLKQACYREQNVGHFALALPCYTHFTSPIRRYPDLIVHRILRAVLASSAPKEQGESRAEVVSLPERKAKRHETRGKSARLAPRKESAIPDPINEIELAAIAVESSEAERRAADAERELIEWKQARFMRDRLGEEFDALIISVFKFGFFVELIELFIEGIVPIETLTDQRYVFQEQQRQWVGERTRQRFRIGDRLRVRLDRIGELGGKMAFSVVQ